MDYISCMPQTLYRDGGFFEHPELLFRLCDPAATPQDECRAVGEIYPPYQVVRPMPELLLTRGTQFRADLLSQYTLFNRDAGRGAASVAVALDGATLHANVLYTTSAAGFRPVYETHRVNDRPYVPLLDAAAAAAAPIDLSEADIANFFIGSAGSFNYGHWLVDDLPRIRAIPQIRAVAGGRRIRILITSYGEPIDGVRIETLQRLCRGFESVEVGLVKQEKVYCFDTLYYVTPISYHPLLKSPDALALLADELRSDAEATPGAARIFVTRRPDRSRALLNADAVERLLITHGFATVDVEAMHFTEQARVFGSANVIVGCMGAAMTNCLFAGPGTQTLYLCPEGWFEPFYWDVAAVRGHRYSACYGPLQDPSQPAHLNAYSADLAALGSLLEHALAAPAAAMAV